MSADNFLSQDEVDALLAADGGDSPAQAPAGESSASVDSYDFGSPERVARRRLQALELVHERFARYLRADLLAFIHRNADTSVGPMRVERYADFERNLPMPSNLNIVSLAPLRGYALFTFDPALIFLIIESLFGGQARYYTRVEGRDFTATEQRIIERLMRDTLESYTKAWSGLLTLDARHVRSEMQAKFANVAGANEVVVVTPIRIEFGSTGGTLNVCLPYSMLEPVRDLLVRPFRPGTDQADNTAWAGLMRSGVRGVPVRLAVNFAHARLTLREVAALEVGSVVPIELPRTVQACVGAVPVIECGYGTSNGHYALIVRNPLLDLPTGTFNEVNTDGDKSPKGKK
ncbi:MAG: flagellar motor switch protein FliM [Candidimonas sp.]|nr:MAG: flagellar motor switch protein FliM [Candidimonas sp.]